MNTALPVADENVVNAMKALLQKQQQAFLNEGAVPAEVRIDRLRRLAEMIGRNKQAIIEANNRDFGNRSRHQTEMAEVGAVMAAAQDNIRHIKKWMKPEKRKPMFPLGLMGARARVEYQPKGVVGNLSTWNFPVYTALLPLVGIFAAGNRAMIKMSELTPHTAETLQRIVAETFDPAELSIITGGPEIGAAFAALPFDHIVFTGGTHIGRQIMAAAAKNLTPVTLELGGKSPVIVGRSYDITKAADRIMQGKALNIGQACLAPDYCFVPEEQKETFLKACHDSFSTMFPTIKDNPDYTSVINERHYLRVKRLIDDAKTKGGDVREINPAKEDFSQQKPGLHKIPLTLVADPTEDMLIMQEEIFGPALAVKTYQNLDECLHYIKTHPRPLGLYCFTHDAAEERKVLDSTISGGVTLNDVMNHSSCDDLPFGGIGPSGMGSYHGQDGFRTFSHARAVFKQTGLEVMKLAGMLPPYGEKCQKQLDKMTKV